MDPKLSPPQTTHSPSDPSPASPDPQSHRKPAGRKPLKGLDEPLSAQALVRTVRAGTPRLNHVLPDQRRQEMCLYSAAHIWWEVIGTFLAHKGSRHGFDQPRIGAAIAGARSLASMKHVGMNVAADPLLTLAYLGVEGGMVVLSADEPSLHSTQNEQDTRYYGKLGYLPILEPSSPQDANDMTKYAFELSEKLKLPVILRTTTRVNHSRGIVTFGALKERRTRGAFVKDPLHRVAIPASVQSAA